MASESASFDQLLTTPFVSAAASTLLKHLAHWDSWAEYCDAPSLSDRTEDRRASTLAEFVVELAAGGRRRDNSKPVSCVGIIPALTFVPAQRGCTCLAVALGSSLVVAFRSNPDIVWDRKECLPLPLLVVVAM